MHGPDAILRVKRRCLLQSSLRMARGSNGCAQIYSVSVVSQDDDEIEFWVGRQGSNASPIYSTSTIRAAYGEGSIEFQWSDNWDNSGTGTLAFAEGSVTVKMIETTTASGNRSSLQTDDEGLNLPKVSDDAPEKPMA